MEIGKTRLALTAGSLALALALAGCGGGGSSSGPTATGSSGTPPPVNEEPETGMATSGDVEVPQTDALLALLPNAGDSHTLMIAAGMSETRGGVTFMCSSDYGCDVELMNDLGKIVASWTSQNDEDGMKAMVTASVPDPVTPTGTVSDVPQPTGFAAAAGDTSSVKITAGKDEVVGGVKFSCPAGGEDCTVMLAVDNDDVVTATWEGGEATASFYGPLMAAGMNEWSTSVIRERISVADDNSIRDASHNLDSGVLASDGVDRVLTGPFDPNHRADDEGTNDVNEHHVSLKFGREPDDSLSDTDAGALDVDGWWHTAFHKDWGDSGSGVDGGYETFAVLYSNRQGNSRRQAVAFDSDLASLIADDDQRDWFTLVNGSVPITLDGSTAAPGGKNTNVSANAADSATLTEILEANEKVLGVYFGAEGSYTCGTGPCTLSRSASGEAFTLGAGTWQFTPAADAMVTLVDQDWMSFGFWLTAPDNEDAANAIHRVGVFEQGMDTYALASINRVTGKGTYEGSAAGIYVDGDASGLFAAMATLEADFGDVNTAGMLSGSIHSFRNTDGTYIGDDPDNPEGNSDWTVVLNSTEIGPGLGTGLGDNTATTSGSADGGEWSGAWTATFYGGGDRLPTTVTDMERLMPSGVGGTFRAFSKDADMDMNGHQGDMKGVVGAFGAARDGWTPTPATQ